jgi:hypothetical protein
MNTKAFDGTKELGVAPIVLDYEDILRQLQGSVSFPKDTGKGKRRSQEGQGVNEDVVWKKKSISSHCPIGKTICYDTTLMWCT